MTLYYIFAFNVNFDKYVSTKSRNACQCRFECKLYIIVRYKDNQCLCLETWHMVNIAIKYVSVLQLHYLSFNVKVSHTLKLDCNFMTPKFIFHLLNLRNIENKERIHLLKRNESVSAKFIFLY